MNQTEFHFIQTVEKYYPFRIIVNTTIKNPCYVDDVAHICNIIGDGTVHHFGQTYPGKTPSHILINCTIIPPPPHEISEQ